MRHLGTTLITPRRIAMAPYVTSPNLAVRLANDVSRPRALGQAAEAVGGFHRVPPGRKPSESDDVCVCVMQRNGHRLNHPDVTAEAIGGRRSSPARRVVDAGAVERRAHPGVVERRADCLARVRGATEAFGGRTSDGLVVARRVTHARHTKTVERHNLTCHAKGHYSTSA